MCRYIGASQRKTPKKDRPELTGSVASDVSKNIYDLAGNVWEWTMEANFTNSRTVRGGDCSYDGESYPVSARFSFKPTYTGEKLENIGSRMILY